PPCITCSSYTNTLAGRRSVQYQPQGGSYYSAVGGTHRGWLRGPAGTNFDLRLEKRMRFRWKTIATSEGPTSEEQIAYAAEPGTYRWRIKSAGGRGEYTFWLQ